MEQTPSIASLRQAIKDVLVVESKGQVLEWKRRYLKGLDGRPLYVRSVHSALNLLLQSAGALVCKYWIVTWEQKMIEAGYRHGEDFQLMAWVHDEGQMGCRNEQIADDAIRLAQEAMRETQAYYSFNCQLDTEGKKGSNWAECH